MGKSMARSPLLGGVKGLLLALAVTVVNSNPLLKEHRCVSKNPDVTDAYCAKVNCDPRFEKFCVWLDSPEGGAIISHRDQQARQGVGAQDVLNTVVNSYGSREPDSPAPRETLTVESVKQNIYPDTPKYASCWVPTKWYPKHECGNPNPHECGRGWSVFTSQEECCQPGAAFTKGCDGFKTSLRMKDKIINSVLGGDPRVAQDEALWLRDMTRQRERREAEMEEGFKTPIQPQHFSFDGGGILPPKNVPQSEPELKPGPVPGVEEEVKPATWQDLAHFNSGVYFTVAPKSAIPAIFSKKQFAELFPFANFHAEPKIYTYENFVNATSYFPSFAGVGDTNTKKRELAAFFAHISQETSGWWSGQNYTWGLTYNREEACGEERDACDIYAACHTSVYTCAPGKHYYGRGPMMISWNYNYGECSQYLFGDDRLLSNPDLVANDGVIAFMSALWYWMEPHGGYGKPSSHDAITGLWKPSGQDTIAGRTAGFGLTLNIVDGGNACLKEDIPADAAHRVNYYLRYCNALRVPTGPHVNCKTQIAFVTDYGRAYEMYPETDQNESRPGSNTTQTMGDSSYHHNIVNIHHSLPDFADVPPAPFDKYKFLQSGRKCAEDSRIMVECGDCGPHMTDFQACSAMCDAHLQCRYFNYFNDKACSLYSDCSKTEINLKSTIYLKQSHASRIVGVAPTWPAVAKANAWVDETSKKGKHHKSHQATTRIPEELVKKTLEQEKTKKTKKLHH